jgi:hypothetical protein
VVPGVSAALLLGNGFKDGYNIGLGVRGGYTLPMNLYLGATFIYHLGKSEDVPGGSMKANVYYFGVEAGYAIAAGPVAVRPYLGLGQLTAKSSVPDYTDPITGVVVSGGGSNGYFTIWPGVTALFPIGPAFVGADLRYNIVTGLPEGADSANAFSAFLTGGMSF